MQLLNCRDRHTHRPAIYKRASETMHVLFLYNKYQLGFTYKHLNKSMSASRKQNMHTVHISLIVSAYVNVSVDKWKYSKIKKVREKSRKCYNHKQEGPQSPISLTRVPLSLV